MFVLCFVALGLGNLLGQGLEIHVLDRLTQEDVAFARVVLVGEEEEVIEGTLTDEAGRCYLKLWEKGSEVWVSVVGYAEARMPIPLGELVGDGGVMVIGLVESEKVVVVERPGIRPPVLEEGEIEALSTYQVEMVEIRELEREEEASPFQFRELDAGEMSLYAPQTLADAVERGGDVFVQRSQQGGGSPNMRGFEANKVLLMVDGIRMNNAIYRGGHLQNIITLSPEQLGQVDLLWGAGAVRYGSDALGGVLHLRTKEVVTGVKTKLGGEVGGRYSSVNHEKLGFLELKAGGDEWGFLTSIQVSDYDDLRTGGFRSDRYPDFGKRFVYAGVVDGRDTMLVNSNVRRQRYSGYRQYNGMHKVRYQPNRYSYHDMNVQYSTSSDIPRYDRLSEYGADSVLKYAEWYYGPQFRLFGSYRWHQESQNLEHPFQSDLTLGYQDVRESRHTRRFGRGGLNERFERVRVFSVNWDGRQVLGESHSLRYGAEAVWNLVGSEARQVDVWSGEVLGLDTRYPDGGSAMRLLSGYLMHRWYIGDKWVLTDGVRFTDVFLRARFDDKQFYPFLGDEIRQDSRALSGHMGIVGKLGGGWRLNWGLSTGFRAPNVDDVGKVFDSNPGNVIVPNGDVSSEYTYGGEFGVRRSFGDVLEVEGIGFATYYKDALVVRDFRLGEMDSILYEGVMSRVQATVNVGRAWVAGFSGGIRLKLGDAWDVSSHCTYTYGQDLEDDVPLDHIPPVFGRFEVRYHRKGLDAGAWVRYNGWKRIGRYSPSGEDNERYATVDGMPGWFSMHVRVGYEWDRYGVRLTVDNLLDRHYRVFASGVSAGGLGVSLGGRVRF